MIDQPLVKRTSYVHVATRGVLLMALLWLSVSTARSIKMQLFGTKPDTASFPDISVGNMLLPPQGKWRFENASNELAIKHPMFGNNGNKLSSARIPSTTPHLLPLLGQTKRMCGRWSDSEQLLMEIVQVDATPDKLLSTWLESGWQIKHSPWGKPNSFSYLCAKNGRVVYAWSQQTDTITSLLLSSSHDVTMHQRTPSEADNS